MMAHTPNGSEPQWMIWAREIRAIGQTGLYFSKTINHSESSAVFDQQRYSRLVEISAEIIETHSDISKTALLQTFNREAGYITPKIDVRAAVFEADNLLLVQDRKDQTWSMPGGYADINELPSRMVEREVLEESGITAKAIKIVGVYEANRERNPLSVFYAYRIIFLCQRLGGELRSSEETSSVKLFAMDELPELSGPRTNLDHVVEAYQHHIHPDRSTYFE
jgi:ADP-ribose pyrophosphatase YjhB (NUDIX family)